MDENWICLIETPEGILHLENNRWEILSEFIDRVSNMFSLESVTKCTKITFQKVL